MDLVISMTFTTPNSFLPILHTALFTLLLSALSTVLCTALSTLLLSALSIHLLSALPTLLSIFYRLG